MILTHADAYRSWCPVLHGHTLLVKYYWWNVIGFCRNDASERVHIKAAQETIVEGAKPCGLEEENNLTHQTVDKARLPLSYMFISTFSSLSKNAARNSSEVQATMSSGRVGSLTRIVP